MKSRISYLFLGILIVTILALTAACSSKTDDAPLFSVDESSTEVQLNGPGNASPNPDASPNPNASVGSSPETSSNSSTLPSYKGYTAQNITDFESSLSSWEISNWQSDNDGELGFKDISISNDQKASGSSSAAITANLTGQLGASKTAKGAIKLAFASPVNFTGKKITAKVFIPDTLVSSAFKKASYGLLLYIKTTSTWKWTDGGWIDIANNLKPGWNEISFSPKGVTEDQTMEIGIQMAKGQNAPDWSGKIYFDDISY
ncbi:hypothetical protein [Pseudobacteroides cellulosolvens]|uniref:Mannanase galactose-binding domain-containing protein n=1 Tax=Pseudobacteroides cellulosolvens ATCC 35603 = DSM 2933 TaxID=398512 RepID=A0A0L6JL87_9FIRM|nr:hypothetical protein [Pseudobacteroides cellulosolvens]KNY26508.1 hypothetical protein Bccel_1773 [Pseudobacteroides cellulosolvens ATCC 35603 = DSM 2933]